MKFPIFGLIQDQIIVTFLQVSLILQKIQNWTYINTVTYIIQEFSVSNLQNYDKRSKAKKLDFNGWYLIHSMLTTSYRRIF